MGDLYLLDKYKNQEINISKIINECSWDLTPQGLTRKSQKPSKHYGINNSIKF